MTTPASPKMDVEFELKELGRGDVELSIRVPAERVNPVRSEMIRAFARRANIPGFRKGKAPRNIVERFMDEEALKAQVVDAVMADAYDAAVEKAGLKPLGRARISDAGLGEDGAVTFKATLAPRPEVELGEYKGLKVTRQVTRVTEAEVDGELDRLRARAGQFVELPGDAGIEKGDLVIVDYEGTVDGERIEEATASGYPLEVGADELFVELNDSIAGAHVGETREITVNYGDDHPEAALAGKQVVFKVDAKSARRRQLPELNDEFAKQVSDLETVEALRGRVQENLEAVGRAIADEGVRSQLTRQVSEGASLNVPQSFVDGAVDGRIEDITEELERRNLSLHQHLQQLGRSFEDWRADLEVEVRDDIRRAIVLDDIGAAEDIEVTEEETKAEIQRLAERHGTSEESIRGRLSDSAEFNRLLTRLYHRKIVQFLLDNAEVTEEEAEPVSDSPTEQTTAEEAEPVSDSPTEQMTEKNAEQASESS